MEHHSEYRQYLFLKKMSNSLTDEEKAELEELLKDKNTGHQYDEFLKTFPAEYVSYSFTQLDQPEFWNNHLPSPIYAHRRKAKRRLIIKKSILPAVLLLAVIATGWMLFNGKKTNNTQPRLIAKSVELKLASGKIIDLNKQTGILKKDSLELTNENGTLSYNSMAEHYGINSILVPAGMTYQINLSDGSKVWMNSETKVDFPSRFVNNRRGITISGEAYLEIAKDPARPFLVTLPHATVNVTGTAFNVNTYQENADKVSLVEGGVIMQAGNSAITLKPGIEGVFNKDKQTILTNTFSAKRVSSWRKGIFYFDEASLNEISPVIQRWFAIKTTIDRPELLSKRFVGVLNKEQSIGIFLNNLKAIAEIDSYFDKKGVLHFR